MAKANAAAEPSMEEILASIRRIISDETPAEAPPPPVPPKAVAAAPAPAPKKAPEPAPAPASGGDNYSQDDLDKLFAQADEEPEAPAAVVEEEEDVLDLSEAARVEEGEALDLVEGLHPDEADVQFVDPAAKALEEDLSAWGIEEEPEPAPPPPAPPPPAAKAAAPKAPPPPPPREEPAVEEEDTRPEEPLVSQRASASVNAAFGQLTHTILSQKAKTLDDLVKEMLRPMLKAWLDENLPVIVERLVRAEIERVSRGR